MTPLLFILVVCSGVVTGVLGALLGIGGGIFLIPVLVIVFQLPVHEAIAASVVTIIATSSATASVYVDRGISNIRLGMSLEVMTTIGAVMGGLAANLLPGDILRQIFSVFLAAMGVLMWARTRGKGDAEIRIDPHASIQGAYYDDAEGKEVRYSVRNLRAGMAVSLFAGNLSGLLGIGGGLVKVPTMNMVCGIPIKAATATSNFMIGVTGVASAFIYFSHGHLNPLYTSAAVLGVLGGSRIGTMLGRKIRSRTLVMLFVGLLFVTAVRMFIR